MILLGVSSRLVVPRSRSFAVLASGRVTPKIRNQIGSSKYESGWIRRRGCHSTTMTKVGACSSATKIVVVSLLVLYGVVPILLYFVPQVHVYLIFLHFIKWPFMDYSNPQSLGIKTTSRNFYLPVEDSSVGVWQILAKGVSANNLEDFDRALSQSTHPIVVYNHGNCWTRCAPHRMKLYNLLAEAGYHVIAFDYRGYGDSPGFPSESGMIKDALTVYEWAQGRAGSNSLFIWGHSLGTAISTAVASTLCQRGACPTGLILECPFNNLKEVVKHHFFSAIFRWMPMSESFLIKPAVEYGLQFNTDEKIKHVSCPVLILHARNDFIVPFHLADTLHTHAKSEGVDISFVEFADYGHKYICNAPELPGVINLFLEDSIMKRRMKVTK